jgi:hypothetical protein
VTQDIIEYREDTGSYHACLKLTCACSDGLAHPLPEFTIVEQYVEGKR